MAFRETLDAKGLVPGTVQVLDGCVFLLFLLPSLLPLDTEPGSWTEVAVSLGQVLAVTDCVSSPRNLAGLL